MKQIVLVFIGGGAGSVCRYLISKLIPTATGSFPYGTFLVNIMGGFLIGLIIGWFLKQNQMNSLLLLLLATGFCGGFTTFSTFSYENMIIFQEGNFKTGILYILLSFGCSLLAVGFAMWCMK